MEAFAYNLLRLIWDLACLLSPSIFCWAGIWLNEDAPSCNCVVVSQAVGCPALADLVETALAAYGLPLDGGATSKTGQLTSFVNAFDNIYTSKSGDLATLVDVQDGLNA